MPSWPQQPPHQQGSYPQSTPHPYAGYPAPPAGPKNGLGIAALVIAIIALVFFWSVAGGVTLGLLAVIFGFIGRGRIKRGEATNGGVVVAGIVLGFLAIIASLAVLAFTWDKYNVYIGRILGSGDSEYHHCMSNAHNNDDAGQCHKQFLKRIVGKNPGQVAVDPGTHTVYVANSYSNSVSVIDASTRTVTTTVPVGKKPIKVAVDPTTHTVYAANDDDGTVSVIDGSARTVTAIVPVGKNPYGVAVDPGSHTVYVANNGDDTVSVIDASTRTVTATVPVGSTPNEVAVDPGTHTVYVNNDGDGTVSVIDASTRTVTATVHVA